MHKKCLMWRPRTQTSSPLAGRAAGTLCMTSCRVPPTQREASCPSACLCPSCTSMQGEQMQTVWRTTRAPRFQLRGRRSRRTANLPCSPHSRAAGRWTGSAVVDLSQLKDRTNTADMPLSKNNSS
ncbi:hypothetical protein OJAV_G00172880 [Oryzias javanicus]|uniref:Uncharacterized protein n=1 Tax=Oryzias javanicus TaxID=123683 RepID=A0A3S2PI38_ORYJA|nr:hypothetical protein OJAV_G00172880 [Oryzias javanicus]